MTDPRVSDVELAGIIQVDPVHDLTVPIETAADVVAYIDSQDSDGVLTENLLHRIELLLAAHYYALLNQQYMSNKNLDASATYQTGQPGKGAFEVNDWGRQAMSLDITGTLAAMNEGKKDAEIEWGGTFYENNTDDTSGYDTSA